MVGCLIKLLIQTPNLLDHDGSKLPQVSVICEEFLRRSFPVTVMMQQPQVGVHGTVFETWNRVKSFAICDTDSKQSKTKIYEEKKKKRKKTHFLLRILAVIGRYGPHLMIVMIFVTQNNF